MMSLFPGACPQMTVIVTLVDILGTSIPYNIKHNAVTGDCTLSHAYSYKKTEYTLHDDSF